jgi:hypothetical protein
MSGATRIDLIREQIMKLTLEEIVIWIRTIAPARNIGVRFYDYNLNDTALLRALHKRESELVADELERKREKTEINETTITDIHLVSPDSGGTSSGITVRDIDSDAGENTGVISSCNVFDSTRRVRGSSVPTGNPYRKTVRTR